MRVHHLRSPDGAHQRKVRVGRGESGRRGKTAGRGMKGQKARGSTRLGFEGGQTPLNRRLPKMRGFKNPFRVEYDVINLAKLEQAYLPGEEVTPESLREKGLIRKGSNPVKVLGAGELSKKLSVKVHAASATASEKITAAGGTVEQLPGAKKARRQKKKTA